MSLSWQPVRRGEKYCSPACGGGCTYTAWKRAHANAKALAKRLGSGWKVHVWENLGWHYEVVGSEVLCVSRDKYTDGDTYTCMLKPHYTWFGRPKGFETPERAIYETVKMANAAMHEILKLKIKVNNAAGLHALNPKRLHATKRR